MIPITGATRLLAIVGDPIAQARSPAVLNALLAHRRRNVVLVPWHTASNDFVDVMRGLMRTRNLDGIVLTYPHKQAVLALAEEILPRARQVGAANAMRRDGQGRWIADMFDGLGLVRALATSGVMVVGRRIKLIGAGGAGSAVAFALAAAGAASMELVDLDEPKAAALARAVMAEHPCCTVTTGEAALAGEDIVINATTVGLHAGDGTPVPLDGLTPRMAVADIAPRAEGTALLAAARALGCATTDGGAMVEGQAAALLDFFGMTEMQG